MPLVLLIDDESGIRFALRRFFERWQWSVREAGDGDAAMKLLAETQNDGAERIDPDLIVLDLHLPGVSGSEILAHLRATRPVLADRVILTTGDAISDAEPGSMLAEHPHVLQKPFDLSTLRARVAEICP